jgi:hypothetical protein
MTVPAGASAIWRTSALNDKEGRSIYKRPIDVAAARSLTMFSITSHDAVYRNHSDLRGGPVSADGRLNHGLKVPVNAITASAADRR